MTEETEKSLEADPKEEDSSAAKENKTLVESIPDALNDLQSEIRADLKSSKLSIESSNRIKRLIRLAYKSASKSKALAETLKKERAARLEAQSGYETLRVQNNIMALEVEDMKNKDVKKEEERYDSFPAAGEW
tara:strand:- start:341 stop:739 length:399 start_codon:yes stop_codon:yes gene_type:complete